MQINVSVSFFCFSSFSFPEYVASGLVAREHTYQIKTLDGRDERSRTEVSPTIPRVFDPLAPNISVKLHRLGTQESQLLLLGPPVSSHLAPSQAGTEPELKPMAFIVAV